METYKSQAEIIKMLLNHTPKERPSAMELLKSPLLPQKLEESHVTETIWKILDPENQLHYTRMINMATSQVMSKYKDFTYDLNNDFSIDSYVSRMTMKVLVHAMNVFKRHGAGYCGVPLFIPKTSLSYGLSPRKPFNVLDSQGNVLSVSENYNFSFF